MHHEVALIVGLSAIMAPALVCLLWLWGRNRAKRFARREMIRRNKVCRDWMNGDQPSDGKGPLTQ